MCFEDAINIMLLIEDMNYIENKNLHWCAFEDMIKIVDFFCMISIWISFVLSYSWFAITTISLA